MRLTRDEIILVSCLVFFLVLGAVVKHYRDRARLAAPPAAVEAPRR